MGKIAVLGLVALLLVGIVATGVSAFGGKGMGNDDMQAALENADYDAYIETFDENDKGFMRHQLTEEEFNERLDRRAQREDHRASVEVAMDAGDYDAWFDLMEDSPRGNHLEGLVTEENFDEFVQMHEAYQTGDFETASEISDELGIEKPDRHGHHGMRNGQGRGNMRGCMQ